MLSDTMTIRVLEPADLADLLSLQSRVINNMDQDYFLVQRDADHWAHVLASPDFAVYGIFDNATLIASGTVHFPNGVEERDIPEFAPVPDNELAIFRSAMTDPEYRGHGLMGLLQNLRQGAAIKRKRGKIICKISADNLRSWRVTINNGFHCVRVAPDKTGHDKMYFIKKLRLGNGVITK